AGEYRTAEIAALLLSLPWSRGLPASRGNPRLLEPRRWHYGSGTSLDRRELGGPFLIIAIVRHLAPLRPAMVPTICFCITSGVFQNPANLSILITSRANACASG